MVWASMAASGTVSLVFADDVAADRSSWMASEVSRAGELSSGNLGWLVSLTSLHRTKDNQTSYSWVL